MRLPLLVFRIWHPKASLGTQREVFFLSRLPSGRSMMYATLLSCLEWNNVRAQVRDERKDSHVRYYFRLEVSVWED